MNDINEKIEKYEKRERRKTSIIVFFSLIIIMPLLSFLLLPNMGGTSQASGVVLKLVAKPSDEGNILYLLVKLKNGKEVLSYIRNTSLYKQGKKVKLEKQEPLVFGRPKYRFIGYIDSDR